MDWSESQLNLFDNLGKAAIKLLFSYLQHYGYLNKSAPIKSFGEHDVICAVKAFQQHAYPLIEDGIPGPKTMRAMMWPRCACPDILPMEQDTAEKASSRYWRKVREGKPLTWKIVGYVKELSSNVQVQLMSMAWASWAKHTNLIAKQVSQNSNADVVIGAGTGSRYNFDGPNGTLAWAYLPDGRDRSLRMMFDDAETWVNDRTQRGILYLNVAAHELGHILGLDHSKQNRALMAPFYSANIPEPQANDDVTRIQGLYGRKKEEEEPVPTPTPTPDPTPSPQLLDIHLRVKEIIMADIDGHRVIKL